MAIDLDHFIVSARHGESAARTLGELLGVPWGVAAAGPFHAVYLNDGTTLDFFETEGPFPVEHFCFRVDDATFDAILGRLRAAGIEYRSLVRGPVDFRVDTQFGGRGVYWNVPEGHQWEMLTVSYARRPGSNLTLRTATAADAPLLRHWDEQPHIIASDPDTDWEWEKELAREPDWREQLIAEVDGKPVGFLQVIDPAREDSHYWGDVPAGLRAIDIWIGEAAYLGQGIGTRMMRAAIDRCFADPDVEAILIDPLASNLRAHRFYERLGFRFVERRRFGGDDCRVYRLDRPGATPGAAP